jgi:hypothetical protein
MFSVKGCVFMLCMGCAAVMLFTAQAAANCVEGNCTNGIGKYRWANGAEYSGAFKDGAYEGKGTYAFPNGATYSGEWAANKKSGFGVYAWPDGKSYEGQWANDVKAGYGIFKWPDGTVYKGDFTANRRAGYGTYSWPNGASYEGEWVAGKKNGAGIYTFPDGNQVAGTWEGGNQTVTRELNDVRAYLDTLRMEQEKAIAAATAMKAAPSAPSEATAGPVESTAAADDVDVMEAEAPSEASAMAAPATAFQLAVMDLPMGRGAKVTGLDKRTLVTRGDHQPAGLMSIDIRPGSGKDASYALELAIENQSKCHLNFDGFIRIEDTYFPLVKWRGQQAIAPGGTQQTSIELDVGSDLFGDDVIFKGQGFAERCGG